MQALAVRSVCTLLFEHAVGLCQRSLSAALAQEVRRAHLQLSLQISGLRLGGGQHRAGLLLRALHRRRRLRAGHSLR